uniref:Prostate stem cell antigen-like n=1 Tax=Crassostrea virginica TaxID=6565 RepID=A0A8B8CA87_CRAVI|nr:prostate stem cell antigen-like [Crassostrea virginica]
MVLLPGLFRDIIVSFTVMALNLDFTSGLQCYNCTTKWEFDACVVYPNQSSVVTCEEHQDICLVQRNETFGKFDVLVRRCATSCLPHCGVWGDDIDTEQCYSCCSSDLCNTDNAASRGGPALALTLNVTSIFLLLYVNVFL